MPAKKKKYNARFPAGRIKKIMQSDEEIGKVAQAVPIIISRTLELFVHALLKKTEKITFKRNAKTLSPGHIKQCIEQESNFDFLRDLVKNIPDHGVDEGESSTEHAASSTAQVPDPNRSLLRSHSLGTAMLHVPVEPLPLIVNPNIMNFYGSNNESNHVERPTKATIQRNYSMPASSTITSTAPSDGFPFKIEIVPDDNSVTDLSNYSFPIASNSASFKIDFSNFNQLPGSLEESSSPKNHMDEDYDNI